MSTMTLTVLQPIHSASYFRILPGAVVTPRRWDGDWLEVIYEINPEVAMYFHVQRLTTVFYFGVADTDIVIDPNPPS